MKKILKYILIFFLVVFFLVSFLIITAKIPKEMIEENLKESTEYFRTNDEVEEVVKRRDYTFRHPYADAMILNITYCIDSDHPLESILEAKYHAKEDGFHVDYNFNKLVEEKVEGNTQYIRYWHGNIGIMRILLVFLNLGQIYLLNAIVLLILAIILCLLLGRKKTFALMISLIVAFIMCVVVVVPSCIEYTSTFMIMLIVSILSVIWMKDNKKLNILFFISGMLTCFFDFLTTEIITILVPVLIVLILQVKENKITNFKEGIIFVIRSCFLWGISYSSMWIAKWVLSSIVLKINAFDYVWDNATYRIKGEVLGITNQRLHWKAIQRNVFTLYPLNIEKNIQKLLAIPIVILIFEIIFIRKKNIKKLWLSALLIVIACIPYLRYYLLANHSYMHYFFTFRSQMISIIAILLAIIYSIDIEQWKEKIKKRK